MIGFELIPFIETNFHLSENQKLDEERYLKLLKNALGSDGFYFSYSYDVTRNIQKQHANPSKSDNLFVNIDKNFCFNHNLLLNLSSMAEQSIEGFLLPIIQGFVGQEETFVGTRRISFTLISRRNWHKTGTRYHSRGIDRNGNVSNFVETEQIVSVNSNVSSFVQVRGSVPVYWNQQINIKYKPHLAVSNHSDDEFEAFKSHFQFLKENYGPSIIAINLINKHGYESPLGHKFDEKIKMLKSPDVGYIHFDFHKECKKMQWHKLNGLIEMIDAKLNEQGYFVLSDARVVKTQSGIVRSNCVDCLDRTNVYQSLLAKKILFLQLRDLNIIQSESDWSMEHDLLFKKIWADNADMISLQYSGTGALKTDYTRTGKRSFVGIANDGINSAVRYVKNNFFDGERQDSFDLLLGKYVINSNQSPFRIDRPNYYYRAPLFLLLIISVLTLNFVFDSEFVVLQRLLILACMLAVGILVRFIVAKGEEFVDYPKLIKVPVYQKSKSSKKLV